MRASLRAAIPLAAVALLGGCRLPPGSVTGGVTPPPGYQATSLPGPTAAADPWWNLYQDEVLVGLLQTALAENRDLKVALARIDEARALVTVTGAARYPTLDLGVASGWSQFSRVGFPAAPKPEDITSALSRLSLDMSWELDVFGRIRNETAAQQALYFATVEAHQAAQVVLVAEVARVYFELRSSDAQLEITTRTLASTARYVELAKVRFEGGKTSELDFRQAEAEHYRTEVQHLDAQRQITLRENQLSVLLGRSPGAIQRGRGAADQPVPFEIPAGLPSDLVERRPDVRERGQNLRAEAALVGAARANLYPRIALTGQYGVESADITDLLTSPAQIGSIAAGLLQPIFNAGRNQALIAAQRARLQAAAETYAQSLLTAFQEVEDGLVSYRSLREQRGVQEKRVTSLRRVLSLAETRYVGGVSAYLEVLDAQRGLFDAELEANQTMLGHLVALTQLYKALGGGWEVPSTSCGPCAVPVAPAPVSPAPGMAPSAPPPPSGAVRRVVVPVAGGGAVGGSG